MELGMIGLGRINAKTPWIMLRDLGHEDVPWNAVHVIHVDNRIALPGDFDRNLTHLLLKHPDSRTAKERFDGKVGI